MRKKNGGKQLGTPGGYGVAFIPALKCDSLNKRVFQKGTIGKLFYYEQHANEAWSVVEKFKKVDPKQKLLLYPSDRCDVYRVDAINQEKGLDAILKSQNISPTILKFQQHIMKHGGITLKQYLNQNYSHTKRIGRAELIYLVKSLFFAVDKLQDNSYIHQDIKFGNIVISNKNGLRLIDFDLLCTTTDFYDTKKTKIREIYNGQITDDVETIENKYNDYVASNKINDIYNTILEQANYRYVSPPEYYAFSVWMIFLLSKINERTSIDIMSSKNLTYAHMIGFTIHPKNYYEGNMLNFYKYLGMNDKTHTDDINVFLNEVTESIKEQTVNPTKDYWIKNKLALKSDVFSIGLLLLRICSYDKNYGHRSRSVHNIFKDASDEPSTMINYNDDGVNGPRVVKNASSKTKQINVVDAFNTLMRGLLWGNPKNRFTIKKAISWVKLICLFLQPNDNPFTKNADSIDLAKDMKTESVEQYEIDAWFKELNASPTPVKKSRFTIISTTHKY